ncbi:MAG: hypothetical protein JWN41_1539 [Thermoleophilia bacterium]|nr:hypothetical protein [Thermoleophilia bacterium]
MPGGSVRLTNQHLRWGVVAAASSLTAAAATVAWVGARGPESPARERIAAFGYAPGLVGLGVSALAAPLLIAPRTRAVGAAIFGVGAAAAAGLVVGGGLTRVLGARPRAAVLHDAELPKADRARARAEADLVLAQLDLHKRDLVLWLPGTYLDGVPRAFGAAVSEQFGRDASVATFTAHHDYHVPQGVVDTAEALRIVLRALEAKRRPDQRIVLGGESQGAWSISVAMSDPALAKIVDRAMLTGNPGVSQHQYDDGTDRRVREIDNPGDAVAVEYRGNASLMIDALERGMSGEPAQAARLVPALVNNPISAAKAAVSGFRIAVMRDFAHDPHNYDTRYAEGVAWLAGAPARHDSSPDRS